MPTYARGPLLPARSKIPRQHPQTPYYPKQREYLVGHRQAFLAYTLTGSVFYRKVENSEAGPKTLSPTGYIIAISWLQAQTLSPILTPYNTKKQGTSGRPHTGLKGLHADRARSLPQGRRFRDRITKLCLPLAIFSLLLASGPNFNPFLTP